MTTIGIVGFGRFGRLMTRYLAPDFKVTVFNRKDIGADIQQLGARAVDLATACGQEIVIFSVPISVMEQVLQTCGPMVRPDALVVDVCSVKEQPVEWMHTHLPPTVSILATHPMFGPDSAAQSLKGHKIVLCDVRSQAEEYQKIKDYLQSRGLIVIETTPEIHDRQIAVSLALTHFIGRSLSAFGARPLEIDTEGYQRLLHTLGVVEHDTWQLFEDMHRYNRYAAQNRRAFAKALGEIERRLEGAT